MFYALFHLNGKFLKYRRLHFEDNCLAKYFIPNPVVTINKKSNKIDSIPFQ